MKKIIGILAVVAISIAVSGCHPYKKKGYGKVHKGHSGKYVPSHSNKHKSNCAGLNCRHLIR